MELKNYISKIKLEKGKELLPSLTLAILKTEAGLIENHTNIELMSENLTQILINSFLYVKENKIEINDAKIKQLDLDYWKNNVVLYKSKSPNMIVDVYLYSIRNSLMFLLDIKKDKILQRAYIFELIIKTFLFIDFLGLSIDILLDKE